MPSPQPSGTAATRTDTNSGASWSGEDNALLSADQFREPSQSGPGRREIAALCGALGRPRA